MAAITLSQVSNIVQSALVRAKLTLQESGIYLKDTVWVKQVPEGKSSVSFGSTGDFTAVSYAEGIDVTQYAQSWSSNAVVLTPTNRTVVPLFLPDTAANALSEEFATELGEKAAKAVRQKINSDVWALFAGFSQSATGGGTTTDISEAIILNAYQRLANAGAPAPYFLPVTAHVMEDLMTLYSTSTSFAASELRNMVQLQGMLPPIYGVTPVLVSNLPTATKDAASVTTALYSPYAIGFAELQDIDIIYVRNEGKGGYDIICRACYEVGEVNDDYGCAIVVDNDDSK